jgi:hypothetical protein
MQISVLIEPVGGNGYRATSALPFAEAVEAPTREEASAKLRAKIESRLKNGAEVVGLEVGADGDPWMAFAGMFKGDPWIDDWKRSVKEYRKKIDEDPDAL